MKIVAKKYKVFKYSELSKQAKEKVKEDYIQLDISSNIFENFVESMLFELFPNSTLDYQYSLSNCQGDGFNIYGELNINDLFDTFIKNIFIKTNFNFNLEELEEFQWIKELNFENILIPCNRAYSYSIANQIDFKYDMYECLKTKTDHMFVKIQRFENKIKQIFEKLNNFFEEEGYNMIYNIDDAEMEDFCEINDWEFLEDGTFFAE